MRRMTMASTTLYKRLSCDAYEYPRLPLDVQNGQSATVHVAAGVYTVLVRYGNRLTDYIYSKGGPIAVLETPTQHSNVKIVLPKSPSNDDRARKEFEEREENKGVERSQIEELRRKLDVVLEPEQSLKPGVSLSEARQRLMALRTRLRPRKP